MGGYGIDWNIQGMESVEAVEHATDTTTIMDSLMFNMSSILDSIFPDSTFASPRMKAKAWSGSHRTTLESIAEECPYEYGNAVHMARAMLSQYDTIPYYSVNVCEQWAGPPSGKHDGNDQSETTDLQGDDEMSFNLYPNPNIGRFTVTLDMDETDRAEMTIWNVTGQQVYSSKLEEGSNAIHVNVAQGLYIYRVLVNGVSKWTGKISISPY